MAVTGFAYLDGTDSVPDPSGADFNDLPSGRAQLAGFAWTTACQSWAPGLSLDDRYTARRQHHPGPQGQGSGGERNTIWGLLQSRAATGRIVPATA